MRSALSLAVVGAAQLVQRLRRAVAVAVAPERPAVRGRLARPGVAVLLARGDGGHRRAREQLRSELDHAVLINGRLDVRVAVVGEYRQREEVRLVRGGRGE